MAKKQTKKQFNKKGLIVGLTVGIPAAVGLGATLGVCLVKTKTPAVDETIIPTDMLDIDGDGITLKGIKSGSNITKYSQLVIPSTIRNISEGAFKDAFPLGSSVNKVKFNKDLRTLGDNVFDGCTGLTHFDLSEIDEESAILIDFGNNIFGEDEQTIPKLVDVTYNSTWSDETKETVQTMLENAGIPKASFVKKTTGHIELKSKEEETAKTANITLELNLTEEEETKKQEGKISFVASADKSGGTPGVGVKLSNLKITEIEENAGKKYKASVDAELVNAKNNGDYVLYKVDMICTDEEENVLWVQNIDNFKLVYNEDAAVHAEKVVLDQTNITIDKEGEKQTKQLIATVLPEKSIDKTVTWKSSDDNIATVDQTGKVTGVAYGEATITATTVDGGHTATCDVTVEETPVPIESLCQYQGLDKDGKSTSVEADIVSYQITNINVDSTYQNKNILIPSKHNGKYITSIDDGRDEYSCMSTKVKGIRFEEDSHVEVIQYSAFVDQSNLETLTIPASVKVIGAQAFKGATNLKSIKFEKNSQLEVIGHTAFAKHTKIESIKIPASVKFIGRGAFGGVNDQTTQSILSNLEFEDTEENPSQLEYIDTYFIENNKNLTSITIPASVNHIGVSAFQNTFVTSVIFKDTTSPWFVSYYNGYAQKTHTFSTDPQANATELKSDSLSYGRKGVSNYNLLFSYYNSYGKTSIMPIETGKECTFTIQTNSIPKLPGYGSLYIDFSLSSYSEYANPTIDENSLSVTVDGVQQTVTIEDGNKFKLPGVDPNTKKTIIVKCKFNAKSASYNGIQPRLTYDWKS